MSLRLRITMAALVAALGLTLPAAAQAWRSTIDQYLKQAGLSDQQQQEVWNQVQRIEQQRQKELQQRRKQDQKKSLEAIKEAYEKGKKAYQEKRYSAAYLHFLDVASSSLAAAAKMSADAQTKVIEIEAMALGRLEQAKIFLLQDAPLQAAELFQQIVEDFPYCDAAKQAKSRLQTLRSVPSVAASMRYGEGKAQEQAESYAAALEIYDQVVQRWPTELAALRAKVAADTIRQDAGKMDLVRESRQIEADRVCPTLINLAKSFIMNYENHKKSEHPDGDAMDDLRMQAAEKLNQVIRDFPDSKYAQEAQQLLDSLAAPTAGI